LAKAETDYRCNKEGEDEQPLPFLILKNSSFSTALSESTIKSGFTRTDFWLILYRQPDLFGCTNELQRFQLRLNRWNRCNFLFLRIIRRKTASHFCWKCYEMPPNTLVKLSGIIELSHIQAILASSQFSQFLPSTGRHTRKYK